jgi:hypothetical protein
MAGSSRHWQKVVVRARHPVATLSAAALLLLSGCRAARVREPAQERPELVVDSGSLVRVHFHAHDERRHAIVLTRTMENTYEVLCVTPCTRDLEPGTKLRVTYGNDSDPHDLWVPRERGNAVAFVVNPASKGSRSVGIVLVSLGGAAGLLGLFGGSGEALGGGVLLATVGLLLIGVQSREPRVEERSRAGEREAFKPPAPGAERAHALMPLQLGFTF